MSSFSGQILAICKQAIKQYEDVTGKRLDDPSLQGITTVDDLSKVVGEHNERFNSFRAKRRSLFSAMSTAMQPVQRVGDVAAGGVQMVFPPSTLVFGAVVLLFKAAKGVSEKYDMIVELMTSLKDFTVRLNIYAQERISPQLSEKLTEILVALIEVLAISRQEIKRGRLLSFCKNLFGSDERGEAMDKFVQLSKSEGHLVGAEMHVGVRRANENLEKVNEGISGLTDQMDSLMSSHGPNSVKKILEYSDAEDRYISIYNNRVPGTGNWIRNEHLFKNWIERKNSLLWICGNPGAGKSYIAANIINYLMEKYPQNIGHPSHVSVAYFFFKDDSPRSRSFHQALRDIAYLISENNSEYAKYIMSCYSTPDDIGTLNMLWKRLFMDFFQQNKADSVFIVLDGLDEANQEERSHFLNLVRELQRGSRIQLLMLGRPHLVEEIDGAFGFPDLPTILVTPQNNSLDIVRFIKNGISKSRNLKMISEELQVEIVKDLSAKAQGMFIWADFMLKEISTRHKEGSIRKALKEAPRGLNEMIRHVLEGFSARLKDNVELADDLNDMLAWTFCATTPLKLGQMDKILRWKSETADGFTQARLEDLLRYQFASFFLITRLDGFTTANLLKSIEANDDSSSLKDNLSDPTTTLVSFTHACIGDFFRNETETKISAGEGCPAIGVEAGNAMVMVLKTYLDMFLCENDDPKKRKIADAIVESGIIYWPHCLETIDISKTNKADKQYIGRSLATIFSKTPRSRLWMRALPVKYFNQNNLHSLQMWLSDNDVQECLSVEQKTWYESATANNDAGLFENIVTYISRQWLQTEFGISRSCCEVVHTFLNLRNSDSSSKIETSDMVMRSIEWPGFEKNALWYRKAAMALQQFEFHDEALKYFQKALEIEPSMWKARAGMSIIYIVRRDYQKVIELDLAIVKELEGSAESTVYDFDIHESYHRLGVSYQEVNNIESAIEMFSKGVRRKSCGGCLSGLLDLLMSQGQCEKAISLFKELNTKKILSAINFTLFHDYILNHYVVMNKYLVPLAIAAVSTNDIHFLLAGYEKVIALATVLFKTLEAAIIELSFAQLCVFASDGDQAIRIWERLIRTYRYATGRAHTYLVVCKAFESLGRYCLNRSIEADPSSTEAQTFGKMLEQLAKNVLEYHPSSDTDDKLNEALSTIDFLTITSVSARLAYYYKFNDRKKDAWTCYREQVKESLRLLSDEYVDNDALAYWRLVITTAALEDEDTVGLVYELPSLMPPSKYLKNTSIVGYESDREGADTDSLKAFQFHCDGCRKLMFCTDSFICRYCDDVSLCQNCFEQVKAGSGHVIGCGPKHDWLFIPPIPDSWRAQRRPGHVHWKGSWISVDEWKEDLKVRWEL